MRLKQLYADSTLPRDQGFKNLTWDFDPDPSTPPSARITGRAGRAEDPEGDQRLPHRPTGQHLAGFGDLKDDGSTTCASWIYCGVYPGAGPEPRRQPRARPAGQARRSNLGWGFAWPANRRIMYNRASAGPTASLERAQEVGLVGRPAKLDRLRRARLRASPRRRTPRPNPNGIGLDALSGTDPFIMKAGRQGLAVRADRAGRRAAADPLRAGRVAGPEPALHAADQPGLQVLEARTTTRWPPSAIRGIPYIITTYRLTEHHLSGVMSRWLPWLAELQPELFIELSPELARREGHQQPGLGAGSRRRAAQIRAKALVTRPDAPVHDRRQDGPPGRACPGTGATWASSPATS